MPAEPPRVKPSIEVKPSVYCSSHAFHSSGHRLIRSLAVLSRNRAASVRTQSSVKSTMSRILRRTKQSIIDTAFRREQDEESITSDSSFPRPTYPSVSHSLTRQPSSSAFSAAHSRNIPADLRSISSRRSGRSTTHRQDTSPRHRRPPRLPEEPPSSFKPLPTMESWTADDASLSTAKDIRAEIYATEAEHRRLRHAFDTLESSAAARSQSLGNQELSGKTAIVAARALDHPLVSHVPSSLSTQKLHQHGKICSSFLVSYN